MNVCSIHLDLSVHSDAQVASVRTTLGGPHLVLIFLNDKCALRSHVAPSDSPISPPPLLSPGAFAPRQSWQRVRPPAPLTPPARGRPPPGRASAAPSPSQAPRAPPPPPLPRWWCRASRPGRCQSRRAPRPPGKGVHSAPAFVQPRRRVLFVLQPPEGERTVTYFWLLGVGTRLTSSNFGKKMDFLKHSWHFFLQFRYFGTWFDPPVRPTSNRETPVVDGGVQ